jgi:hypothetical protein
MQTRGFGQVPHNTITPDFCEFSTVHVIIKGAVSKILEVGVAWRYFLLPLWRGTGKA